VEEHAQGSDPDETFSQTARPKKSRQNSDVSQLDEGTLDSLRTGDLNTDGVGSPTTPGDGRRAMQRKRSSSLGTATPSPTAAGSASPKAAEAEDLAPPSSLSPVSADQAVQSSASNRSSPGFVSPSRRHPRFTPAFTPLSKPNSRQPSQRPPKRHPAGTAALKGAIARATTDTTLAVIPAEAFRKLTRKFPKASGTVVQVVLERFSRVTFMTGGSPFLTVVGES
jgi:lysophospholipid hydrolase